MSTNNDNLRIENFRSWYEENQSKYKQAAKFVLNRITSYMEEQGFNFAYFSCREKTVDSAYKKAKKQIEENGEYRLKYSDPRNQIMDFAGVRLVVYLPSDMNIVTDAVERLFSSSIKYDDSGNKLDLLGKDRVGYLSIHYVVEVSTIDPEHRGINGLKCEIQIRTVLQDAWAQIFHDRVYKGANIDDDVGLQRKVNLLSGSLELIDNQINEIVEYYDKKAGNLSQKSYQALLNDSISDKSLTKYCALLLHGKVEKFYSYDQISELLKKYGINTIRELDYHVNSGFIQALTSTNISLTIDRLIRYILVVSNYQKFFECVGSEYTFVIDKNVYQLLDKFIDMSAVCQQYSISKNEKGE